MNDKFFGEEKAVDHICRFQVKLDEGFNVFLAEANGIKDTMTIEKVEAEPEIYTLPQTDDGNEGAANWFTAMGSAEMEDDSPMEFPEGKMSIKTNIGDIYKNEAAWEFFSKMTGGKLGPDQPMWEMMKNFNLETMMSMLGSVPESAVKALNKQLNQFDLV
jgi:beta-galactosidase